MNAHAIFLEYKKLPKYDKQVIFKDLIRRIYTSIYNGESCFSSYRAIKPLQEYVNTFYDFEESWYQIKKIETELLSSLKGKDVLKEWKIKNQWLKSFLLSVFSRESNVVHWSTHFKLTDKDDFFKLHDLVFSDAESDSFKEKEVEPRSLITFDEISGKLYIKHTNRFLLSVQQGFTPDKILRKIFLEGRSRLDRRDFSPSEISEKTTMKAVLGKNKVYSLIFTMGRDYICLKELVDKEKIFSLAKKT